MGGIAKYLLTIPYRGTWVVLDHPYVRKKKEGLLDFDVVFESQIIG